MTASQCCSSQLISDGVCKGHAQFASLSPATRWKCFVLFVTNVRRHDSACAAMSVSNVPIGSPRFAKALATGPN